MSRYLAIDIDPQGLFIVAGTARGGAVRVEHALGWLPGEEHGPPPLTLETAKAIGEQIRDRLKDANVPVAPVLVGIGRDRIILKELRYPPVPPAEEAGLVRFQAMKEISESPDEIVLDYAPLVNGVSDPTAERRAMAVVIRKDVFAAVQAMCAAAGLKLAAVTPRPYAMAAGLNQAFAGGAAQPPDPPSEAAAVLTLGPQGGEFTVVRAGQVSFTRSVPAPVLANEALLLGEVRRNLTVYAGQNPGHPVHAVYVAEEEDLIGGWANRLRTGLPVPVHAFDPLASVPEATQTGRRGRFAGAAGLLAGRAADTLPINFASPRQPKAEVDPRRQQLLLAAIVATLVLGVGGVLGYLAVDSADERLNKLQAEKAGLEESLNQLEPSRKKLEAVDQWAGREVNHLDELFEVTQQFPPGDHLRANEFKATARPLDKAGKQDAQALLELRVGAKNADAAANLVTAIDRSNVGKAKYYVGTQKLTGGLANASVPHNQLFTIMTKVNHRPPTEYASTPSFTPLPRRGVVSSLSRPTTRDEPSPKSK